MTYGERMLCEAHTTLVNVVEGIDHMFELGIDDFLSAKARRKLSKAMAGTSDALEEIHDYILTHTIDSSSTKTTKLRRRGRK